MPRPLAPRTVVAPKHHFRIRRTLEPIAFSRVGALEASLTTAGNRFDVPGGGVLYTATGSSTCFHEVLAGSEAALHSGTHGGTPVR